MLDFKMNIYFRDHEFSKIKPKLKSNNNNANPTILLLMNPNSFDRHD